MQHVSQSCWVTALETNETDETDGNDSDSKGPHTSCKRHSIKERVGAMHLFQNPDILKRHEVCFESFTGKTDRK